MPLKRAVDLKACWPTLCPAGRKLRYAIETAQDYVEKAKGKKRIGEAREAKQGAEDDLRQHLQGCTACYDRTAETRQRLAARAWRARRVRVSRDAPADAGDGVSTAPARTRYRPRRVDGPEGDTLVQYAAFRLEGKIVAVRAV